MALTHPRRHAIGSSTLAGLLALLMLCAALAVGSAPAASAHAGLDSSSPADGSVATTLPDRVELVFNEDINASLAQVVVTNGSGSRRLEGVSVRGPSVSAPLPGDLSPGRLEVAYRVVSADSHPISGKISFTYRPAATTQPTAISPSSSGPGSPSAPTTTTSSAEPSAAAPGSANAAQSAAKASNSTGFVLAAVAAVLVLAVVAAALLRSARRRRRPR